MKISECMKRNVVSIPETSTVREVAATFVKEKVSLLAIVDANNKLVGVAGLRDLLSLVLPDFVNFVADLDFVHDFGAVETIRPSAQVLDASIKTLMKLRISADVGRGLLLVYALRLQHKLHELPGFAKRGQLIGMVSRLDIGTMILSAWPKAE